MESPSFISILIKTGIVILLLDIFHLYVLKSRLSSIKSFIFHPNRLLYALLAVMLSPVIYLSWCFIQNKQEKSVMFLGYPMNVSMAEMMIVISFTMTTILLCILMYVEELEETYLHLDRLNLLRKLSHSSQIIDKLVELAEMDADIKDITHIVEKPLFIGPFLTNFDRLLPYILVDMGFSKDYPVLLEDEEKRPILINWILYWISYPRSECSKFSEKIQSLIKRANERYKKKYVHEITNQLESQRDNLKRLT